MNVETPTKSTLNYQKTKAKNITRIDVEALVEILQAWLNVTHGAIAVIERPMVNPKRFTASASALRALEATLIAIESVGLAYEFIDSRAWQKDLLPKVKGRPNLKRASLEVGKRIFPSIELKGDADGLLIAEWARRKNL